MTFEKLKVFQAALDLRVAIQRITTPFPKTELFGMVSQLRQAAGSVTRNIAEGEGRLTMGERRQFLSNARGSLYEVQSELLAARRLHYIDEPTLRATLKLAVDVGCLLAGYIRYVQRRDRSSSTRKLNERSTNNVQR
jgi:four helix bundle protein